MERKSDIVRRLVAGKDYRKALAIAKGFRIGISREDNAMMTRAYECMLHPGFYRSIGKDIGAEIEKGIEVIKRLYGKEAY